MLQEGLRKGITSYCVAEEAGVSQSAVSRAYKPGGSVSKKTRDKIYAAAKKLGYRPNAIARSLISQKSNMIGIVMGDITNPFYPSVLEVILNQLQAEGLRGMVLMANRDQDVDELLPQLLEYQVDGIIITSATLSSQMAADLAQMGLPVVLFNRSVRDSESAAICSDNAAAAREVAQLFVEKGFNSLGFIAGSENTSTNFERESGFNEHVEQAGLSAPRRAVGSYTYAGGFEAALKLGSAKDYPQAIFCANDIMAMGAMDAIRSRLELRIPEDVSVVGFDDIENASWPVYDLTTVRPPIERMVKRSIENLRAGVPVRTTEVMAAKLMLRGSVKP